MRRRSRRAVGVLVGAIVVLASAVLYPLAGPPGGPAVPAGVAAHPDPALRQAVQGRRSGVMVTLEASVSRLLPDDDDGSRHQRVILRLDEPVNGVETILVAHNIDLAPRVPCEIGDRLLVRGQYEWNEKGGVIHWTHHDPDGQREGGWIERAGRRYE